MAREEKLVVRLEDKVKWNLQRYADQYGVTMSGLVAVVVGQWVSAELRKDEMQREILERGIAKITETITPNLFDGAAEQAIQSPLVQSFLMELMRAEMLGAKRSGA